MNLARYQIREVYQRPSATRCRAQGGKAVFKCDLVVQTRLQSDVSGVCCMLLFESFVCLHALIMSHTVRGPLQFWTWRGRCPGAWWENCALDPQMCCVSQPGIKDFSGKSSPGTRRSCLQVCLMCSWGLWHQGPGNQLETVEVWSRVHPGGGPWRHHAEVTVQPPTSR